MVNLTKPKTQMPEYITWKSMKSRCNNPNNRAFKHYGGRGIEVCEQWLESFENFLEDMGERPTDRHSIERDDNSKGYCPDNCKWATQEEQANNKRSNRRLTFNGRDQTVAQWARELGISSRTIVSRLDEGKSVNEALSVEKKHWGKPSKEVAAFMVETKKLYLFNSLRDLAREMPISQNTAGKKVKLRDYRPHKGLIIVSMDSEGKRMLDKLVKQ